MHPLSNLFCGPVVPDAHWHYSFFCFAFQGFLLPPLLWVTIGKILTRSRKTGSAGLSTPHISLSAVHILSESPKSHYIEIARYISPEWPLYQLLRKIQAHIHASSIVILVFVLACSLSLCLTVRLSM